MSRERLPNRRPSFVGTIVHDGKSYVVSVSLNSLGRAKEVFMDGHKVGSDAELLIDDACILVSRLLQYGDRADKMAKALHRENRAPGSDMSLIERIVVEAARVEREASPIVGEIEAHRAKQRTIDEGALT